jgi:hypothetical protein
MVVDHKAWGREALHVLWTGVDVEDAPTSPAQEVMVMVMVTSLVQPSRLTWEHHLQNRTVLHQRLEVPVHGGDAKR